MGSGSPPHLLVATVFQNLPPTPDAGHVAAKLFNMEFDPKGYASQDAWNQHSYDRCREIIEKYDPDMFNNDAPFPDEKRGGSGGQTVLVIHQP